MTKNFPNFVKDINLQIQEAWQTINGINSSKAMPNNIIKLLKTKNEKKILKSRNRKVTRMTEGF